MKSKKVKGVKVKPVRAYAVFSGSKLKPRKKDEWILPIMLKEVDAVFYKFGHSGHSKERVIPVLISPLPITNKKRK